MLENEFLRDALSTVSTENSLWHIHTVNKGFEVYRNLSPKYYQKSEDCMLLPNTLKLALLQSGNNNIFVQEYLRIELK